MVADTSGAISSLKTRKYEQNPFEWCPLELRATKIRSCGSPQSWVIFDENLGFLDFLKITPVSLWKITFSTFSPYLSLQQNTKEILHKNASNHSEIIFFENSRKSWVSEKKSTSESDAHSALWWRSQSSQLGTGAGKEKDLPEWVNFRHSPKPKKHKRISPRNFRV